MLNIFIVEGKVAKPTEHVLIHPLLKLVWERDTSEDKAQAIKDYTFLEFYCSYRKSNPYNQFSDSELRLKELGKDIYEDEEYRPDDLLIQCAEYYLSMQEEVFSIKALKSALEAGNKVIEFLNTVNLQEKTTSGAYAMKPVDVSKALTEIPKVMQSIKILSEKVEREVYVEGKTTKNREVAYFEDPEKMLNILNEEP